MADGKVLAIIPARGGSKELPRKNISVLCGRPLIWHSIAFARLLPEIGRCIVSTEDAQIAGVARELGAEVLPRPMELAEDTTPMLAVLQHALHEIEREGGPAYKFVLLLQPTNPTRLPEDLKGALAILESDSEADAVVSVSKPAFNPRYVCVEEREGYLREAFGRSYTRRQDAPCPLRINGLLYLFRWEYLLAARRLFDGSDRYRGLNVPEERALDIDNIRDLENVEFLLRHGRVRLPWLELKSDIRRSEP